MITSYGVALRFSKDLLTRYLAKKGKKMYIKITAH